ncbi:hypothetical protein VE25_18945 [Devosia geojensis]|uniref:Uncharacterized protein n=1 Tax=Devosia geojensis TaxID=443610 RepID=A0A0F5FGA0_9HYPH|nr:hypothetical protein [Devosia geojensis]KKB07217.1 hypothetical protein VE25_18945 [Devosia geojensis]
MAVPDPQTAEHVHAALERIQGWQEVARSPQLSRLLSYIVERTLEGEGEAIKAYAIAVDVFGRPPEFDPQTDPIVRVQARRLRTLLAEYYQGPGRGEPLRIELPVGRYVPRFVQSLSNDEEEPTESAAAPSGMGAWLREYLALAGIAALAAALAFAMRAPESATAAMAPPRVAVGDFQNLTGSEAEGAIVAGLAVELATDLGLFGEISVHYGRGEWPAGEVPSGDFVLTGIARSNEGRVQYSAILTDAASEEVVWSHVLEPAADAGLGAVDTLSRDLSLLLGNSRGPLHEPVRVRIASGLAQAGPRSLYVCLMLFHRYRDVSSVTGATDADACFAALPETQRGGAMARAAVASLVAESARAPAPEDADRLAEAEALIAGAMEEGALSSFVWEQRARIHQARGERELARQAYGSALQLNPANADAMAAFALMLALEGDTAAAADLAATTLAKTPQPPPDWYYGAPALAAYHGRDFAAAARHAATFARADRELGPVLAALAALESGNGDMVNRFLPQVLDVAGFKVNGILPQLRKRIRDETLIAEIGEGLTRAGVPPAALEGGY